MTEYHADARCGSCQGPLEVDRDAICHTCVPYIVWFEDSRGRHFFWVGVILMAAAVAAGWAWIVWG